MKKLKNNIYLIKPNDQHRKRLIDAIVGHYELLRISHSAEAKRRYSISNAVERT